MSMTELLIALASSSGITYALGWLAGKKKRKADLDGKRLQNLQTTLNIYDQMLIKLNAKCKTLSEQLSKMERKNAVLDRKIHILTQELKEAQTKKIQNNKTKNHEH